MFDCIFPDNQQLRYGYFVLCLFIVLVLVQRYAPAIWEMTLGKGPIAVTEFLEQHALVIVSLLVLAGGAVHAMKCKPAKVE